MRAAHWVRATAVAAAMAVGLASATPVANAVATDDFYTPPAGFGDTAPGTILRSRPVQTAALSLLPQKVKAWQLLYRTTSRSGDPITTVTTVLRPDGRAPRGLVSYQIAEDASAPQCAPSHAIQAGNPLDGITGNLEILLADSAAGNGFAVSIPDYQGPDSQFGAARQPGYAILDGVRAAEQFAELDLPGAATPVGIWGYSGGSLASGWAAEVQPSYAPELAVTGAAVGGYVTDLSQAALKINGGWASGLVPSVLPGLIRSDPAFAPLLDKYLTPAGKELLARATTQCVSVNVLQFPFRNFDDYLTMPLREVFAQPDIRDALATVNLGQHAPTAPLFVYHAVNDELIPVGGSDRIVPQYCAAGTSVTYVRDLISVHGSLAATGAPAALAWLTKRLTGTPAPAGCSTTTVASTLLTPEALSQVPAFLIAVVKGFLGTPNGLGHQG
nr:lipase family protein [Kibdelosporangium sp. MJ126-NF4]CEL21831.1 Triacylglycerol lipase precursor [Kibdelosporangium sp. MJ126-NF4]CTQ92610.1 Triacylglycerol lipase precursor (EC 3.1.1.3) [Kibdelosporangium sp. MJ126-NF4]